MQTLSLFPNLLTFVLVAPTLLRITVGIIGLITAWSIFKKSEDKIYKWSSIAYFISSVFILVGLYTQGFALVGIALVILGNYFDSKNNSVSPERKLLQILVSVVLVSLLFTGPGFFAIDLPL